MADHALHFVAVKMFQRTPGHCDDCVGWGDAGSEGVDSEFVIEDKHLWYLSARCDGNFLNNV